MEIQNSKDGFVKKLKRLTCKVLDPKLRYKNIAHSTKRIVGLQHPPSSYWYATTGLVCGQSSLLWLLCDKA